jgi:hypothetical protein
VWCVHSIFECLAIQVCILRDTVYANSIHARVLSLLEDETTLERGGEMEPVTNDVIVVDLRMPFWSMVWFMVKWAIAAIPALLILAIIGFLAGSVALGFVGGLARTTDYSLPSRSSIGWRPHPTDGALECKVDDPQYCRLR